MIDGCQRAGSRSCVFACSEVAVENNFIFCPRLNLVKGFKWLFTWNVLKLEDGTYVLKPENLSLAVKCCLGSGINLMQQL